MKTSIIMCALILLCLSAVQAGERPVIRPFAGIGTLMGAPSASDLDYVDADGGDLNQYLKQKKMSPFAGVQVLVPFTSQPPSVFVPRVRIEARSEPESGSLMPMQKKISPLQMRGRNRCRCFSVP